MTTELLKMVDNDFMWVEMTAVMAVLPPEHSEHCQC